MDGTRHHTLAGTGFTEEQHRCVHGRYLLDLQKYPSQNSTLADNLAKVEFPVNLMLQIDILFLEPVLQTFDFCVGPLKRPFRFLAFLNFLGELHVRRLQVTRPLLNRFFELLVVINDLLMHQSYFQHVADAGFQLDQIERLADKILRADFQGAQFMIRLSGDYQHRKVAARLDALQLFHDLETVHDRHAQIKQNKIVAMFAMEREDHLRIHGRGNAGVAGFVQHLFKQADIGFLIINNKDAGGENFRLGK